MSQIVKALSLEVDGRHVLDQSFTAGSITAHPKLENVFVVQPLAVTLHADFESIFTVIQNVLRWGGAQQILIILTFNIL